MVAPARPSDAGGAAPPLRPRRRAPSARRGVRARRPRRRPWRQCRTRPRRHAGGRRRGRAARSPRRSGARRATTDPWPRHAAARDRAPARRPGRGPAAPTPPPARRYEAWAPWRAASPPTATRLPRAERAPTSYMWRRMSAARERELAEQPGPDACDLGRPPGARRPTARRTPTTGRTGGAPRRPRPPPGDGRRSPAGRTRSSGRRAPWTRLAMHDVAVEVRVAVAVHPVREDAPAIIPLVGITTRSGPDRRAAVMPCCSRYESAPATASVCAADDAAGDLRAAECEQHAGRLGRAEGQVERRDGDPARSDRPSRARVAALEQPAELARAGAGPPDRARRPRRRSSGRAPARAARGRGRTGSSRPGPARCRGSRASGCLSPSTPTLAGMNGRPALRSRRSSTTGITRVVAFS